MTYDPYYKTSQTLIKRCLVFISLQKLKALFKIGIKSKRTNCIIL